MPEYKKTNVPFVNPYHFVKKDREKLKRLAFDQARQKGTFTGIIECILTTKTPIFIPNTTSTRADGTSDVFGKRLENEIVNSYDFYSYTKLANVRNPDPPRPVIPGSSLRGVIRSAYETVTNSCYSTTDGDRALYRRLPVPCPHAGRLYYENGKWIIEEMEAVRIPHQLIQNEWREGELIYVQIGEEYVRNGRSIPKVIRASKNRSGKKGYLHLGERGVRKHHERVFIQKDDRKNIEIPEDVVEAFVKNLKLYRDETVNINFRTGTHRGYPAFRHIETVEDLKRLEFVLVYYKKNEAADTYYLSPSMIGREVFSTRLLDILGEHKACDSIDQLCPACRLFGFVGPINGEQSSGQSAVAGRIRITDAHYTGGTTGSFDELYYKPLILKELASPKPSCAEFYLEKPQDADFWTYDYALRWERRDGRVRNNPQYIKNYQPEIKGRKFYWHQPNMDLQNVKENKASKRNISVRPLKSGVEFEFKIFVNNISEEELGNLIWTLEFGGRDTHAHKIGMGKPLGLGSVQIKVKRILKREITIDNTIHYKLSEYPKPDLQEIESKLGASPEVLENFLRIHDFQRTLRNIEYPNNVKGKHNYEWFMANRQIRGTGTTPVIEQTLGTTSNPILYKYQQSSGRPNRNRNNHR
ncbi:MAG: TIGR03986 family type III CRISPR-associated RAMP protein [Candidatus Helarchaeota archaeon]